MAEYRALYRETRPEVFSEILGQDHIVKILKHQIATGTVSHAYLFCGTRGTGKTTTARILAKAVNCTAPQGERPCGVCDTCRAIAAGNYLDVVEIDAASNNGVDNIRELRESVNYPPSIGRRKVYIIDEVHMLSTGAFNALLKTLEEPPEHVMFILATTNPEKLPQTILSRCMRLDFRRVPAEILAAHMADICRQKGVGITEDALRLLAGNADGSVRDSLSILEQCLSSGEKELTRDIVLDFLGTAPVDFFLDLTEKVMTKNVSGAFMLLDDALREGKDVRQLMKDWMAHLRNLMIAKYVQDPGDMLNLSSENIALLQNQALKIGISELNHAIVTIARAINDARYSTQARILMEVTIVTIASGMDYGKGQIPAPQHTVIPQARASQAPQGYQPSAQPMRGAQSPQAFAPVPPQGMPVNAQTPGMMPGMAPGMDPSAVQNPQYAGGQPVNGTAPGMMPGAAPGTDPNAAQNSQYAGGQPANAPAPGMMPGAAPGMDPNAAQNPQYAGGQPANAPAPGMTPGAAPGMDPSAAQNPQYAGGQPASAPAGEAAPAAPQAAQPQQEPELSAQELQDIWRMTFEEVEHEVPKLNVMRRASLAAITGNQYKVLCENKLDASVLKSEKDFLDARMSRRMGRPMVMVLKSAQGGRGDDREEKLEKEAEEASRLLGVDVKLV